MTLPNQITLAGPVRVRCFGRIQRCEMTGEPRGRGCGYRKIRIVAEHPTSARERQACLNEEALRSLLRKTGLGMHLRQLSVTTPRFLGGSPRKLLDSLRGD